ncbi:MAG: hypothetical protein Q9179_002490 [Wetmoreana sp. 5 TL-2023]
MSANSGSPLFSPGRGTAPSIRPGVQTRSGNHESEKQVYRPPPKAREKMRPPEYYTTARTSQAQAAQPRMYPTQTFSATPRSSIGGSPHATNPAYGNAIQPALSRPRALSIVVDIRRTSYEHPPGYIQNPYASEMTAEQRFAVEQEDQFVQGSPMPSCTHSRKPSTASIIIEDSVGNFLKRARRNTEEFVEGVREWFLKTF